MIALFTTSPSRLSHADQQLVLPMLRAYEAARQNLGATPFPRGRDVMLALSAADYLRTKTDDYGEEPWRTLYRHRTLVHLALLDLWASRSGPASLAEWLARLHERDMHFFSVTVASTHPELAEEQVETMTEAREWFVVAERALSGLLPQ